LCRLCGNLKARIFLEPDQRAFFGRGGGLVTYLGKVSKGTVLLAPDANLPEGTPVRIEPIVPRPLSERLKDVISAVHDMPADWAANHDHYIHGTSKK